MQNARDVLTPDALTMLQVIAEAGSFAAAARQLGLVPSALTYRVRQIEDALDVLLFDRSARQARPTEAGVELLREGARLLQDIDAVAHRVRRVATGWEPQLTLSVDGVISPTTMLELVEAFYAQQPPTRLKWRDGILGGTAEALTSGHADLAIGATEGASNVAGLQSALLGELRLTSVLQDRHGQLWIGHRNGLIRTDPRTGAMVQWTQQGEHAVPDGTSIDWLVEAADDTLWLVTQMGSVQQRDARSGRVLRTIAKDDEATGLPDIVGIAAAPDGRLWLGGAEGMRVWDAAAARFVPVPAMGSERVYAFAFEHADRLWLHRMSGVEAWRRDAAGWVRERRIGADEGLPAVESTGLAVDPQRRVWLGTRRGLFRIDPNLRGSRALLRNFGVREGLLSQELNDRGLLMTADGLLATTAADGSVALLDTHLPDPKPVTPNLVVDSLQVSRGDTVQLPGQPTSRLLVMHSGRLKVSHESLNGQEQILRTVLTEGMNIL